MAENNHSKSIHNVKYYSLSFVFIVIKIAQYPFKSPTTGLILHIDITQLNRVESISLHTSRTQLHSFHCTRVQPDGKRTLA